MVIHLLNFFKLAHDRYGYRDTLKIVLYWEGLVDKKKVTGNVINSFMTEAVIV